MPEIAGWSSTLFGAVRVWPCPSGTRRMPITTLEQHYELTDAEKEVLRELAQGAADEEVAERTGLTVAAVQSRLWRFHEGSEIHGRFSVVWAVRHAKCCIDPQIDAKNPT